MDIFAHALWTAAAAKAGNENFKKKHQRLIRVGWAAFWGVFPDLFAFTIPFVIGFFSLIQGGEFFDRGRLMGLPHELYQYSHSLVIWAAVFWAVWAIIKRLPCELFGWALHILIDIPSHSATFYPTPFLFPVSSYKFLDGISWANKWYMIINYSLLAIVFGYMLVIHIRRKRRERYMQSSE